MHPEEMMHDYYAYTGEHLLWMHGRAIRHVLSEAPALATPAPKNIPADTFAAALIAARAMREWGAPEEVTQFSAAAQVMRLFDSVVPRQAAVNMLNGKIASAYEAEDLPVRVIQGFMSGELLMIPRDEARLHDEETRRALPGALDFLLQREQAECKSFAGYLRRGETPGISAHTLAKITRSRPVLRTWEREALLLRSDAHD